MSRRGLARLNAKRDAVERPIIEALEAQGFSVAQLSGKGIPDLLITKRPDFMRLAECKSKYGVPTPAQRSFAEKHYQGPPIITLRTVEDALKFQVLAMEA